MIPDTEIAWLAGIFDGEGGARIYRVNGRGRGSGLSYFAQVQAVSNTDPQILERVMRALDALGLRYSYRTNQGNTKRKDAKAWWKACGDVRLRGHADVVKYLEVILPYTTGHKKAQVESVLSFVRLRLSRGGRNHGYRKPPEWRVADEALYQAQPLARSARPPVN